MQDLKVIGVENGALLASSEQGGRYRIPMDEVLQSRLRPHTQGQTSGEQPTGRKVPPRVIQAQIRAGLSAQDVADASGVPLEYVQKFEGPVLAEREHVVKSALAVTVHTAIDVDPLSPGTSFGTVISERLASLGASAERWTSWKDDEGWVVKLEFTAEEIDHDARWRYDPKKRSLAPQNNEAVTLSQQGEIKGALIPRLRAVPSESSAPAESRFDSGAFRHAEPAARETELNDTAPHTEPVPYGRSGSGDTKGQASVSAISRGTEDPAPQLNQTADLLEALRRRRGERESAVWQDEQNGTSEPPPARSGIRVIDVPLDDFVDETAERPSEPLPAPRSTPPQSRSARRGRAAMPSWDEIVFGARSEEDPA